MAHRPKIWTALAPVTLGVAAAFLLAFPSPGMTGSGGATVVISPSDFGWLQLAETHASDDAAGERLRFLLTAVAIEGVTVYRPDQLRLLYRDLLGREIALDAIFALAEAVTARYRNDGYTLSQAIVPPQTIRAGKVRLTVVEGFIDKVLVEGETRGRAGLFRAWGEKIKASRPFQVGGPGALFAARQRPARGPGARRPPAL